jgi:uncharacterized protein (TIGR03067 family)
MLQKVAALVLLVVSPAGQPPAAREDAIKKTLLRWQGTWRPISAVENGATLPADKLKDQSFFVGADTFLIRQGQIALQAGNLQIDPTVSPSTVNVIVKQGQKKDTTLLGIYSLDGDKLKICFDPKGQERPKEFESGAGSGLILATYERVKPKDQTIDIVGNYKSESTSINGQVLEASAVIERRGDAYLITFKKGDQLLYAAMGIRIGNHLSISWGNRGQIGVSAYKIEPGPRLIGQYTTLGGPGLIMTEVLRPEKSDAAE